MIIIMQGVPGSGKSTTAKKLADIARKLGKDVEIVSADNYFMREGYYNFDPTKLGAAHFQCRAKAQYFAENGKVVIVDNTNIKKRDAKFYIDLATRLNIPVEIFRCSGTFQNIHGVPPEKVEQMRTNMETLL